MNCYIALITLSLATVASAAPAANLTCGTLDLTSPLTQHCFPEDGSHHFVCCVDIEMPENPHSPHGNFNPLERVIKAASSPDSYSWCTCSEEICEQQLGGRVAWNQQGEGWRGYLPRSAFGNIYNANDINGNGNGIPKADQ